MSINLSGLVTAAAIVGVSHRMPRHWRGARTEPQLGGDGGWNGRRPKPSPKIPHNASRKSKRKRRKGGRP